MIQIHTAADCVEATLTQIMTACEMRHREAIIMERNNGGSGIDDYKYQFTTDQDNELAEWNVIHGTMLTPRNKTRYNWGRYKEERETDELDAPEYQFTAAEQCGGAMREY